MIWSVHDVTPSTMARAALIVNLLTALGKSQLCILIVPSGGQWSDEHITKLKAWEQDGHVLAAHGWTHEARRPCGLYHQLHSSLFSRDAAEHLGRPHSEVVEIVEHAQRWFSDVGLAQPRLYVPPAWALGNMAPADFRHTSFRWVETLTGIHDTQTARFHRLPLIGFEADTPVRAWALRVSNQVNVLLGGALHRPVRVAVHPNDLGLALSSQLRRRLASEGRSVSPADL